MRYRLVSHPAPLVLLATVALLFPTTTDVSAGSNFASFTLSDQPGITCPNSQNESACSNLTLEPQIRSDRAGNLYASSEHGIGGRRSPLQTTGGCLPFTTLPSPNA